MSAAPPSLTAPDTSAQPERDLKDELFWDYANACWPISDVLRRHLGWQVYRHAMDKSTAERLAEHVRARAHELVDDRVDIFLWALRDGTYGAGKLMLLRTPPA